MVKHTGEWVVIMSFPISSIGTLTRTNNLSMLYALASSANHKSSLRSTCLFQSIYYNYIVHPCEMGIIFLHHNKKLGPFKYVLCYFLFHGEDPQLLPLGFYTHANYYSFSTNTLDTIVWLGFLLFFLLFGKIQRKKSTSIWTGFLLI